MSHQHLSHQVLCPPRVSILNRAYLPRLPCTDSDEHRQLLKVGRAALIVLVQLHNFLIGTLVLVLAEISFFALNLFFSSSSKCVERAVFTRLFALSLSLPLSSHPLSFSVRLSHHPLLFLRVTTLSIFYFLWV